MNMRPVGIASNLTTHPGGHKVYFDPATLSYNFSTAYDMLIFRAWTNESKTTVRFMVSRAQWEP